MREALQRLEDKGLMETSPRALTRVAPLDAVAARESFPVVAALHALATRHGVARLNAADIAVMRAASSSLAARIRTLLRGVTRLFTLSPALSELDLD